MKDSLLPTISLIIAFLAISCDSSIDPSYTKENFTIKTKKNAASKDIPIGNIVTKPGDEFIISGSSQGDGTRVTIDGIDVDVYTKASGEVAVIIPNNIGTKKVNIAVIKNNEIKSLDNVFSLDEAQCPLILAESDSICSDQIYCDASGRKKFGTRDCLDLAALPNLKPDNIKKGVQIADIKGNLTPAPSQCSVDGETDCVATGDFPATKGAVLAQKLLAGTEAAGIKGTYVPDFPDIGNVRSNDTVNGVAGLIPNCSVDGSAECLATGSYKAADMSFVTSGNIKQGVKIAGVTGTYLAANLADCSADGQENCKTTAAFKAAQITGAADKILNGHSLAGVSGNVTLPSGADVRASAGPYGVGGSQIVASLQDCSADGAKGCVATDSFVAAAPKGSWDMTTSFPGPGYYLGVSNSPKASLLKSAKLAGEDGAIDNCSADGASCYLPAYALGGQPLKAIDFDNINANKGAIRASLAISGIQGTLGDCGGDGAKDCVATASYPAAEVAGLAAKIVATHVVAGVTGTYQPDFPDAGNVLNTDTVDNIQGSLTLPSGDKVATTNGVFGVSGNGTTPTLANCSSDGEEDCISSVSYPAVSGGALTAGNIKTGVTIGGVLGSYGGAGAYADCSSDGETGCTAVAAFPAIDKNAAGLAGKIKHSEVIAGVTGSFAPDCMVDGGVNCLAVTAFPAARKAGFSASDIKKDKTIAGVAGTLDLSRLNAHNIKNGVTINGVVGTYPSAGNRLASGTIATDLTSLGKDTLPGEYEFFDSSGNRYVTYVAVNNNINPSSSDQEFGILNGVYSKFTVKGDANLLSQNIKKDVTIHGVTGSAEGAPADCSYDGGQNCVAKGTYFAATACSSNGDDNCFVDNSSNYDAADLSNLHAGNIKNGVSIAGLTGEYPSTNHRLAGNTIATDLTSQGSATPSGAYEFFDSQGNVYNINVADGGSVSSSNADQVFGAAATLYSKFTVQGDPDLVSSNIKDGVNINGVLGNFNSVFPSCSSDGEISCTAVIAFPAIDKNAAGLAGKIKHSAVIAGVTGSFAPDCAVDGGTNCLAISAFPAARKAGFSASDIKQNKTIAGVAGTLDISGLNAGNIKNGVTINGVVGTYPSASNRLANGTNATDLTSLGKDTPPGAYEFFDSAGEKYTTTVAINNNINPSSSDQEFGYANAVYSKFTVKGDANLLSQNIKKDVTILGVTGSVEESPADCSTNGGQNCVATGSYFAASACSSNGEDDCFVASNSNYDAADLTNLLAGNIKNGVSIAGLAGEYPSTNYRLAGNTNATDLTSLGSSTPSGAYEFFDSKGDIYNINIADGGSVTGSDTTQNFGAADTLYSKFTIQGDPDLVSSNIKDGVNINGVVGNFKSIYGQCVHNGQKDCVANTNYKAAADKGSWDLAQSFDGAGYYTGQHNGPSAGDLKRGVVVNGVTGNFPSSASPLPRYSDNGTTNNTSGSPENDLNLATFDAKIKSDGTFEYWDSSGQRYEDTGDSDLIAENIKNAVNIFGVDGGILNCQGDGEQGCITDANFPSVDIGNISQWDVREGKVVGGINGKINFFKNGFISDTYFDNQTAPAIVGQDLYDSIDDQGKTSSGNQATIAPTGFGFDWPVNDGSNWVSHEGDQVYEDKLTGLFWRNNTLDDEEYKTWYQAYDYCSNKNIMSKSWRLPTQKELMQAYLHKIWSIKDSSKLNFSAGEIWSATTDSSRYDQTPTPYDRAYTIRLGFGRVENLDKTDNSTVDHILCVSDSN